MAFAMLSAWNTLSQTSASLALHPMQRHLTWHHPPFRYFILAFQSVTIRNLLQKLHDSRDLSCLPGLCGLLLCLPQLLA